MNIGSPNRENTFRPCNGGCVGWRGSISRGSAWPNSREACRPNCAIFSTMPIVLGRAMVGQRVCANFVIRACGLVKRIGEAGVIMKRIATVLMLATTTAAAQPNVPLYQLQENCGKLATETFRREPADEHRVDYRAHYNALQSKCFYVETYISR